MFTAPLIVLAAMASSSLAIFTPTEPDSTSVFREGQDCTIKWVPDTTGTWTKTNIELKTGDNFNMIHVKDIAVVNGSDPQTTSYTYPCYSVTPNSAIYFYQFTSADAPGNTTWTTRFTIAGPNGETTPPTNATQPGTNDPIPWGTGQLEDPSQADPATTTGGTTGATGITTPAGTVVTTPTTTGSKTGTSTSSSSTPTKSGAANVLSGSNFVVAAAAALVGSMML